MISSEQHKEIIRRYIALTDYAESDCSEWPMTWMMMSRELLNEVRQLAKKMKITTTAALRTVAARATLDALDASASEDGFAKVLEDSSGANEMTLALSPEQAIDFKSAVRDSRIFEISGVTMKALLEECSEAANRDLKTFLRNQHGPDVLKEAMKMSRQMKSDDYPADDYKPLDLEGMTPEQKRAYAALIEAQKINRSLPSAIPVFPDKRPFKSCIFMPQPEVAFGSKKMRSAFKIVTTQDMPYTLGFLISEKISCLITYLENESFMEIRPMVIRWRDEWVGSGVWSGARMVDTFVRLVNDFQKIIEEQSRLGSRLHLDKIRKKQHRIPMQVPPPFYVVNLSDDLIKKNKRSLLPSRPREWNHRWPVRGHAVIRYRRGQLPIHPKIKKLLLQRRYQIWTLGHVDLDVLTKITKRGIRPPKADEWLATLVSWRNDFIKGPEGKPFIPSVHRIPEK